MIYVQVAGLNTRGDVLCSLVALPDPAEEDAQVGAILERWTRTEYLERWARVTVKPSLSGPTLREYEVDTGRCACRPISICERHRWAP